MRRPAYDPNARRTERERFSGRVAASVDFDSGERVPMGDLKPETWKTHSPSFQSAYLGEWARRVREATPKPFCQIHDRTQPCPTCWRIERDLLNAEAVTAAAFALTPERVKAAEAW